MARRWTNDLTRSDVTAEGLYLNRRQIMAGLGAAGVGLSARGASAQEGDLELNSWEEITTYNNFYEYGTGKTDPSDNAGQLTTAPWSIEMTGLFNEPRTISMDEIMEAMEIEERIYRLRCVEAWSMVIPWQGFELADLIGMAGGLAPEAQFLEFQTLMRPEEMPGQKYPILDWPYIEGLRADEAMHPLTIMATGLYDKPIPNQNGAPIRLVVPWKYGFKSGKSITRITAQAEMPQTAWMKAGPNEYGFYANVNPNVDHPRWSQATERRVGGGLFSRRQDTLMFNGYDEVASLYEGMDLEKNF